MKVLTTHSKLVDQIMVNCLTRKLPDEVPLLTDRTIEFDDDMLKELVSTFNMSLYSLFNECKFVKVGSIVDYNFNYYMPQLSKDPEVEKLEEKKILERGKRYARMARKNPILSKLGIKALAYVGPVFEMIGLEVDDFVKRIIELSSLFQIELTDEEIHLEFQKYGLLATNGSIIRNLKYSLNLAFTKHMFAHSDMEVQKMNAPLPEDDLLGMKLFPRRLRVTLNKLRSQRDYLRMESLELVYTVFQGYKKGLWPMRPDGIEANLKKHRSALTKDGSISSEMADNIERIYDSHFLSIGKTIDSIKFEPKISHRATIESSCVQGGALGYLYRRFFSASKDDIILLPQVLIGFEVETFDRDSNCNKIVTPRAIYDFDVPSRQELLSESKDLCLKLWQNGACSFKAQPSCIIEPMKIRIITKPTVGSYQGLRRIQKMMHSYLRRDPIFELIGSPMDLAKAESFREWWAPGKSWVSGDYSGATDNLKSEISEIILKKILNKSNLFLREPETVMRALQSFSRAQIILKKNSIPDYDGICSDFKIDVPEDYQQTNGQLMGHVLSFPILCIANYIAYVMSLESYLGREVTKDEIESLYPVRINGDDILFCTTSRHYEIWLKQIKEFGFFPSQGKNFFSKDFFQINSMMFQVRTHENSLDEYISTGKLYNVRDIREVHYVNFGLALARRKNDCSKDFSVARTGILFESQGFGSMPEQLLRVISWPRIYKDYVRGLSPDLLNGAKLLWCKHQKNLLKFEDVILPIRVPGIDFEPDTCPLPWEGCLIRKDNTFYSDLVTNSPFDPFVFLRNREFDLEDLKKSVRRIRSFRSNEQQIISNFSTLPFHMDYTTEPLPRKCSLNWLV